MNDWLDYQGSGSSRAYIAHSKLFGKNDEQTKADLRLLDAYAAKAYKLKDEYVTLLNNYNTSLMMYNRYRRDAESQESKRAEVAKSGRPLKATQDYESNIWRSKKDAANAKSEADSYLVQMKANIDAQKKLQADANELKVNMKKDTTRSLTTYDPKTIFIPDELPSNVNQRIRQSYFDMPVDKSIVHAEKGGILMNDWLDYQGSGSSRAYASNTLSHAFLGIESRKEREARLKDQKEKQSKAESALIDSQFDLARKYQTEYNQNKDKLTKAKKSADDLYSRYSETAAQLTKLEKQQREMSSSGVSQEVLRRNVPIIPQLRNKKEVLNNKYQEAYAKYTELRDRQKWLDNKLKSIAKYFDADGHIEGYGSVKQSYFDMPADDFIEHADVSRQTNGNAYNSLNAKLDQLYKSTQDLINVARNLRTSYESMISSARNAKKNLTLAEGKYKMWETAYNKIDSDIDAANISDMQKTALRNKLERILSGAGEISKINTGGEIDMNADAFNNIISSIQNAMRR